MTANTEKNSCRPGFGLIYARKKFLAIVFQRLIVSDTASKYLCCLCFFLCKAAEKNETFPTCVSKAEPEHSLGLCWGAGDYHSFSSIDRMWQG